MHLAVHPDYALQGRRAGLGLGLVLIEKVKEIASRIVGVRRIVFHYRQGYRHSNLIESDSRENERLKSMRHNIHLEGFNLRLRPVRIEDAAFIVWLRNLDYVKGNVGDSAHGCGRPGGLAEGLF